MKYLELKNTVEKLLNFMERYNLDDYNERLVKSPPRGGLTEMYVADDDREKMNKINDELGELKKKLANYELI